MWLLLEFLPIIAPIIHEPHKGEKERKEIKQGAA